MEDLEVQYSDSHFGFSGLTVVTGIGIMGVDSEQVQAVDTTTVRGPSRSQPLGHIHSSVGLPSLTFDFSKVTKTKGTVTGESLAKFPTATGRQIPADRGFPRTVRGSARERPRPAQDRGGQSEGLGEVAQAGVRKGRTVQTVMPELASCVISFTKVPKLGRSAAEVLAACRTRLDLNPQVSSYGYSLLRSFGGWYIFRKR